MASFFFDMSWASVKGPVCNIKHLVVKKAYCNQCDCWYLFSDVMSGWNHVTQSRAMLCSWSGPYKWTRSLFVNENTTVFQFWWLRLTNMYFFYSIKCQTVNVVHMWTLSSLQSRNGWKHLKEKANCPYRLNVKIKCELVFIFNLGCLACCTEGKSLD